MKSAISQEKKSSGGNVPNRGGSARESGEVRGGPWGEPGWLQCGRYELVSSEAEEAAGAHAHRGGLEGHLSQEAWFCSSYDGKAVGKSYNLKRYDVVSVSQRLTMPATWNMG